MEPQSKAASAPEEVRLEEPAGEAPPREAAESRAEPAWHPAKRIAFRFLCLYFALYAFPFLEYCIPGADLVTDLISDAWDVVVPWVGEQILHLSYEITVRPNGSGDTTYNYVQVLIMIAAALAGGLVWTVLDRRRTHDRRLARWLIVGCRYYLAVVLLLYGFGKVFKAQFPFPGLEQLLKPYGDSSPMGLVWTFMGYSKAYNVFTGGGEVLAGLLLLCRRTTTLGALVAIAVMSNVTMLNFAYDVPVKVFSSHLLCLAMALGFLDLRRLVSVLVLNQPAPAADLSPHFGSRRQRFASRLFKTVFIGWVLYHQISYGLAAQKRWGDQRPEPPLYGIYEVTEFTTDGELRPPLVTDTERWRRLVVDRPGWVSVQLMDGRFVRYSFELDEDARTAQMWPFERSSRFRLGDEPEAEPAKSTWSYEQPSPERLILAGELDGARLSIAMEARDPEDFLLVQRGFRWINEYPFNR